MNDAQEIAEHLRLKSEQKLKRLSSLMINEKELNNFFESRKINPTAGVFVYNSITQKYEFANGAQKAVTASAAPIDTATTTLTCPANRKWRIRLLTCVDDGFRATSWALTGTISGVSLTLLPDGGNQLAGQSALLIGAPVHVNGAGSLEPSLSTLEMNAGDTLTITESDFQAGDTWIYTMIYEEIVI